MARYSMNGAALRVFGRSSGFGCDANTECKPGRGARRAPAQGEAETRCLFARFCSYISASARESRSKTVQGRSES